MRGYAEPCRRDLLDGTAPAVPVCFALIAYRVFAAFARVRSAADAVHGNRQRFVRFPADRAERHRAGGEPLDNLAGRFHFFNRDGRSRFEFQQAAQSCQMAARIVGGSGKLLKCGKALCKFYIVQIRQIAVVILDFGFWILDRVLFFVSLLPACGTNGVLQFLHRFRVIHMVFAAAPPLILPPGIQIQIAGDMLRRIREGMARQGLPLQNVQSDAAQSGRRSGQVLFDEFRPQPNRLENLCAAVRLQRGDAHFGERFQQALADGLDEILFCFFGRDFRRQQVFFHAVCQGLEGKVGIDRARAVADEQCKMHDLAHFARFHDDARLRPRSLPHQMVMYGGSGKQRGNRHGVGVYIVVGENQERTAACNRPVRRFAQSVECVFQGVGAAVGKEPHRQARGLHVMRFEVPYFFQIGIGQNGRVEPQLFGVSGRFVEQVAVFANVIGKRHHEFLAYRVNRGIGDLREQLLEVIIQ